MGQQKHFILMKLGQPSTIKQNAFRSKIVMLEIGACLTIV